MPGQLLVPSLTAPGSRQPPAGEPPAPAGGRAAGVTAVTHRARDRAAACRSGPVLLGVTRRHGDSDSQCKRARNTPSSGTLFQAAQIRANHLAHGSGLGKEGVETRVAGLLTASDATYGEKNMPWHGSYGKSHT